MNVKQLRHILAEIEQGTIGRASQILNISQQALSKCIRRPEENLGARLPDRGPRGMVPTVYGESLVHNARAVRAELNQARIEIDVLRGVSKGHVSVGTGPSITVDLMPRRSGEPAIYIRNSNPGSDELRSWRCGLSSLAIWHR